MMTDGVFYIDGDNRLTELREAPYLTEELLQQMLADHPSLMPGRLIDPASPRRWLLIRKEHGIPDAEGSCDRWSLDHLFLDQDAIPTFVEVKRSSDTRIRREVVGQMLDYAANAIKYWPAGRIRAEFESQCQSVQKDADETLRQFLNVESDEEIEEFWNRVDYCLQHAQIRLLFVADIIPPELQRIVEFLNEQMRTTRVLAIEVRQYAGENGRVIVPRVLGRTETSEAKKVTSGAKPQLDRGTFLELVREKADEQLLRTMMHHLDWAERNAANVSIVWGIATFSLKCQTTEGWRVFLSAVYPEGTCWLSTSTLSLIPALASISNREQLAIRLQAECGMTVKNLENDYPALDLKELKDSSAAERFTSILQSLVDLAAEAANTA